MAKTKISEFDTDPDLNTDINSINIAEGCAPSGINNAIRTLMSDLKEWQSGAMDIYIAPAGTAAAPSWTFNGDLDTGFYRVTANELGVAVGGSAVGRFTSAGFVGNVTGNASTVTNGVYTTGDQTIAGVKTFSSSPVVPTAAVNDNSTNAASTAFVVAQIADDAPTKTGTGASGTWAIDISGNAATATAVPDASITAAKLSGAQSGSAPVFGARAWVNFNGTGSTSANQTINGSGNVSSVYKNGDGDYTVNFSTALPNANYAVFVGAAIADAGAGAFLLSSTNGGSPTSKTASEVRIVTRFDSGNAFNAANISVIVFG
jgi:hypothetical protein